MPKKNASHKDGPRFAAVRDRNRMAAAGRAMALLMQSEVFAGLRLGEIGRLIAGQVNRDHYLFLARDGAITGFVGWARCSQEAAEKWLRQNDAGLVGDGRSGDCVILNAWLCDGRDMNLFLRRHLRTEFSGIRKVYARRRYADGRHRALVLTVGKRQKPDATA